MPRRPERQPALQAGGINIGNVSEAYLLIETTGGHEYEGWIY
jgi:hypothetical protein